MNENGAPARGPGRIFIVDDHPLVIEGLSALIAASEGLEVCGHASSSDEALRLMRELEPEVALLDLSMDGGGLVLIRRCHALYPHIRLLVVSMYDEASYGLPSMSAGAMGYVNKRAAASKIVDAIRSVLEDKPFFDRQLLDAQSGVDRLSTREFEVFELIANGLTPAQIATRLRRSVKTVETHRDHIKEKLGLQSSHALTVYAVQWMLTLQA